MNVKAYAKINLGLRIVEKRADGFHNIETIFHYINLFDEISVKPTQREIMLHSSSAAIPSDNTNVCWKVVELLQKETGSTFGAEIELQKNIPTGAGLGGGSSDAALLLRTLPSLWKINISQERLAHLALQLGSDVPFFLLNTSAYAESRGEVLFPFSYPLPYWIVLIYPNIHVSTPWAYREFSTRMLPQRTQQLFPLFNKTSHTPHTLENILINDFEKVVFETHPEIGDIKKMLLEHTARFALMSGSGSSVFGLFEQEHQAREAVAFFSKKFFVSLTEPNFQPIEYATT